MILTSAELKNFRSYTKRVFSFSPQVTIITGVNTAGKTNILEAIFMVATGKSFRADEEKEVIEWGYDVSRITSHILRNDESTKLEVVITTGTTMGRKTQIKRYFVNGVARRLIDFVGNLRAVLFWPEDLELITDSPSLRRKYLDFVLSQVDREYRRSLYSYEKGVRQRNKLLEKIRDEGVSRSQLLFWDQLLIKTGNYITQKREVYIDSINKNAKPFGNFRVMYDLSPISEMRLVQYAQEEVAAAVTLVGPHRDDLVFFEKDRNLAKYGSRGEQRLVVLWLKLAELEYILQNTGERPLLLLDDIFSELDHEHREEIAKIVGLQQTIMTTTDVHFLPKSLVREAEMIELS